MPTRNLTLSLPDELVRKAKVLAAQRDTSVSTLVGELLTRELDGDKDDDYEAAWAAEVVAMKAGLLRVGPITWTRDDLHDRRL